MRQQAIRREHFRRGNASMAFATPDCRGATIKMMGLAVAPAALDLVADQSLPYPKGIKVSDAEMMTLNIKGDTFHPEWNYTISPRVPE